MDTLQEITRYISTKLGTAPESITLDATLESVGVDSLMLLDMMFDLEDRLGAKLPYDLPRPTTVGELVQVFETLTTE